MEVIILDLSEKSNQIYRKHYYETFAFALIIENLRTITSIAEEINLVCFQWDVSSALLHAKLDKTIFAKINTETNIKYVKVLKNIYGLKQSPRD